MSAEPEPAFLTVGTEVSAKFKGAFCEAKIKKVTKKIKCRVLLKEHPFGVISVEHNQIKGDNLEVNQVVDIHQGKNTVKAVIQQIKDCSVYDVVFNDGDEKTLRRTQLCLKGGRHFDEKVSLDSLPLYNPEQWINNPHLTKSVEIMPKELVKKLKRRKAEESTPQRRKKRKEGEESDDEGAKKREKRAAASAASVAIEEMDQGDTEISGDGSSSGDASDVEKEREKDRKKQEMERREKSVNKSPTEEKIDKYSVGDVVCYYEDPTARLKWLPGVVVSRKIYKTTPKAAVLTKKDYALRLFTNGKYYKANFKQLSMFEDQRLRKKSLESMNATMKTACERAQAFLDKEALPASWKRSEVFDDEEPSTSKEKEPKEEKKKETKKDDKEKKKEKDKEKKAESESSSSEESEDEASAEERDLFVAQLYKFQEDRGTPINRAPVLGGKDIDLYRFYQVVQNYGGAKRVTANGEWKKVLIKLKLEGCPGATPVTVRKAYGRYLAHFNSFYKSLGAWTQSSSGNGTASPRDRRVLLRGPTEDKKKKKKPGEKGKNEEKESTEEKESSVEAKDGEKKKEEKKEEKRPVEKAKDVKTEKIERSHSISEKEKTKEVAATKAKEEKKEPEKKKEEKKKPERKKEDSESTAEHSEPGRSISRGPSVTPKLLKKSESTNDEDEEEGIVEVDDFDLPFKGKRPKGYEDDADYSEWTQADIFNYFYLGQKVRAWHHGKWYEARVVNFHQPVRAEMLELLKKHEHSTTAAVPEECVRYLSKHIQDTRVFVHYLGWNSRYDENVCLAKLKCETKDVESSLSFYRGSIEENFFKKLLQFVRGAEGIGSLKREHTKGGGLGVNGYRPRRITREKYEQILAAELSQKPRPEPKQEATTPVAVSSLGPPPSAPAAVAVPVQDKPELSVVQKEEPKEEPKTEEPAPQPTVAAAGSPPREETSQPPPVVPPEPQKEPEKEKTPKVPTPAASPRAKRQRTVSATSNRTASPIVTPPSNSPVRYWRPPPRVLSLTPEYVAAVEAGIPYPPHAAHSITKPVEDPTPVEVPKPVDVPAYNADGVLIETHEQRRKRMAEANAKEMEKIIADERLNRMYAKSALYAQKQAEMLRRQQEEEEAEDEEEDEEEDEDEEEEEDDEEETMKLREMPRRVTIMGKEPLRPPQIPESTSRRRRRESESVEEVKDDEDDEEEEFEQLEEEAKNLLNTTREDESGTESGSGTPQRDDGEEGNETAEERATPGKTKKPIKRKRMLNSRHSQMVVDKKYIKHKSKSHQNEESEEEEEEESAFNKESYVKRKNNMYKQLEADNKLDDCSSIGLECITKQIFAPEQIIPNYEAHLIKLRSIYASARQEIHILERQRRAQEDKKREVRDRERHLKESMSSPSGQSSSSTAADSV